MPRKVFTAGEVLAAADVNTFLMDQSVMSFAGTAARGSAIGTATEGMLTYLNDSDTYESWNGSAWVGIGGGAATNAIINGAFDISQRGTSFTNPSSFAYTIDRWRPGYDGSGATRVLSRQNHTPGAAPVAGQERPFFFRFDQTVAGSAGTYNLFQTVLEGVETFAGQTVTISFYAKAAANITLPKLEITQSFGSGGSSGVDTTVASSVAVTTSWQRFSYSLTVPSISGKTVGTNSVFAFNFYLPINTTFTFDLDGVQVEAGSTATPFRRNANSLQGELAACQRYYYRQGGSAVYETFAIGRVGSTTFAQVYFRTPVTLRTGATSVEFSSLILPDGSVAPAVTTLVINQTSRDLVDLTAFVASGLTVQRVGQIQANNSLNAFVAVSAEL